MVLEWLRHQLSDAVFEGLARPNLFFGELKMHLGPVTDRDGILRSHEGT